MCLPAFFLERGDEFVTQKSKNILLGTIFSLIFLGIFLCFPSMAYAAKAPSVTQAAGMAEVKNIIGQISPWFNSLCVLATGFSLIQVMVSRDQKVVSGALKFITTIFAVFVIFNLSGAIIQFVGQAVPNHSYTYSNAKDPSIGGFSSGLFKDGKTK